MAARIRWALVVMAACLIGGMLIQATQVQPRLEPRLLPAEAASSRPIPGTADSLAPAHARRDAAVRGASHQVLLPMMAAAADPAPAGSFNIKAVQNEDSTLQWAVTPNATVRVTSRKVKLILDVEDDTEFKIEGGAAEAEGTGTSPTEVQLDAGKPHALKVTNKANNAPLGAITVIAPADTRPAQPEVSKVFNNKYANASGVWQNQDEEVRAYGGYLRVQGTLDVANLGDLRFALFDKASDPPTFRTEVPARPAAVPSSGEWTTELQLPPEIGRRYRGILLAYAIDGDKHVFSSFSTDRIEVHLVEKRVAGGPPVITDVLKGHENGESAKPESPNTWLITNKSRGFQIRGTATNVPEGHARADSRIVLYQIENGNRRPILDTGGTGFSVGSDGIWTAPVRAEEVAADGDYQYEAELVQGDRHSPASQRVTVMVRTRGPSIVDMEPRNLLFGPGRITFTVYFDKERPLGATAVAKENYSIKGPGTGEQGDEPIGVTFDERQNSVTLTFKDYAADGEYTITVKKQSVPPSRGAAGAAPAAPAAATPAGSAAGTGGIVDIFGNSLESDDRAGVTFTIIRTKMLGPSVRPGITGATGPYVPYQEYTEPREVPSGFNPNDKVETRVVRLYYYRDAHRVAQIVNREVRSYNRQGVDMARQLADKARTEADQTTESRKAAERAAIVKAQETRRVEEQLRTAEQSLNSSIQELTNARRQTPPVDQAIVDRLDAMIQTFSGQVTTLRASVERARTAEIQANELTQHLEGRERLAREEQFRREVAAAHADPDTYAPGVPGSDDPVQQVSISVIGEGLIHLRGPLKGVNIIRTMIDQIDQPVGQVRVSVHTVQINGEKHQRMEDVANIIQMYIDHARFLTMQSAEMLRKAVIHVASRKAEEAMALYPGDSQRDRDRRYLDAFFGREFISELEAMDSEFLRSGNKILALHSMDTTSLSSALNLLALAKNSTRLEILSQFEQMTRGELPAAEACYMEAGMTAYKKKWSFKSPPKFYPLAHRAAFQSLKGFFDAQIAHDETLTPLQREFIRLAQIFKSRLITELEYKQRVMERAIIEDRFESYKTQFTNAANQERLAKQDLAKAADAQASARETVARAVTTTVATVAASDVEVRRQYRESPKEWIALAGTDEWRELRERVKRDAVTSETGEIPGMGIPYSISTDPGTRERWITIGKPPQNIRALLVDAEKKASFMLGALNGYNYERSASALDEAKNQLRLLRQYLERPGHSEERVAFSVVENIVTFVEKLGEVHFELIEKLESLRLASDALINELAREDAEFGQVHTKWVTVRTQIEALFKGKPRWEEVGPRVDATENALGELLQAVVRAQFARQRADRSRRPLDHVKFLDMLIDDLEEKYIELLDGTRAHTANVDAYLKRLTTALDDDFNTQFYFPAFRYIRETSTYWDVQFGQTETTSVLANNREFAKVDPAASMEFDLPARSIALAEALNGAKAMMDDMGALANDPTFLAMAKLRAPNAVGEPAPGTTAGFGVVRDVLPGLQSTTAEHIMAQNASGRPQFGSNLENLIPDPAIYKFETGTGYEIRPVIQPDGQAVVFDFHYMYTTEIREPVRADEKHLGRVKRHFIDTDVQLSNFELREVSRYTVALKAARTSRGVPMLEDIPLAGVLFRPLPSAESSLQQNLIYSQATIFPTLFDLMGLRWAPAVADLDALRVTNREFVVRGRHRALENRVYDYASEQVDEFLRIPQGNRRSDLYRSQETIPYEHPNGYRGPGLDLHESQLQEGYSPSRTYPQEQFIPSQSPDGALFRPDRGTGINQGSRRAPLEVVPPSPPSPRPAFEPPEVRWRDN